MAHTVMGIDWAKSGWVAVVLETARPVKVLVGDNLAALIARLPEADVVAVDMPIGLPVRRHKADALARSYVGARRNSVFFTPQRAVLEAGDYAEANATAEKVIGQKISQQAWALRRNIAVVESLAASDDRVVEVHPEVSFREMAGHVIQSAKTTWNGQHARRALLVAHGIEIPDQLAEGGDVPVADVLDAGAAAWSARRYADRTASAFPPDALRGQREVIWF